MNQPLMVMTWQGVRLEFDFQATGRGESADLKLSSSEAGHAFRRECIHVPLRDLVILGRAAEGCLTAAKGAGT